MTKPDGMSPDESWFWDQHIEQVKTNGAGGGDMAEFVSACKWWGWYRRMEQAVEKDPDDYRTFIKMSMSWKNFNIAASKLGLSPTERAKLRIQAKPEKSAFQRHLERKKPAS